MRLIMPSHEGNVHLCEEHRASSGSGSHRESIGNARGDTSGGRGGCGARSGAGASTDCGGRLVRASGLVGTGGGCGRGCDSVTGGEQGGQVSKEKDMRYKKAMNERLKKR